MMYCASCHGLMDEPRDRCSHCGSEDFCEVHPVPRELPPSETWRSWPNRVVIRWPAAPPLHVLHGLSRSDLFPWSGRELLSRVRISLTLPSRSTSSGQAREWMHARSGSVRPGVAELEVQTSDGDWKPAASFAPDHDARIVEAWHASAAPWAAAVRKGRIESRTRVTDAAIVVAVSDRSPASVLDIGCGEGWLARALSAHGIRVIGVDAVPALVDLATRAGGGDFRVASYDEIAAGRLHVSVDVAVANFALTGRETVEALLRRVPWLLAPGGALIVQTVHPWLACGELPYVDGWREGSWDGFGPDFTVAPPWFFRTTGSWVALLVASGLRVVEVREPTDPVTGRPASMIFVAEAR